MIQLSPPLPSSPLLQSCTLLKSFARFLLGKFTNYQVPAVQHLLPAGGARQQDRQLSRVLDLSMHLLFYQGRIKCVFACRGAPPRYPLKLTVENTYIRPLCLFSYFLRAAITRKKLDFFIIKTSCFCL